MRTRSSAAAQSVATASVEESNTDEMVSTIEDMKSSDDADDSEKKPELKADGRTTKNEDVIPSSEADGSGEKLESNAEDGTMKDADVILSQVADGSEETLEPNADDGSIMSTERNEKVESISRDGTTVNADVIMTRESNAGGTSQNADVIHSQEANRSEEKLEPNADEGTIMSTECDGKVESRSCVETTVHADVIPSHTADECQETHEPDIDNVTTMNVNAMPSHASDEKVELRSGNGAIDNAEEIPSQKNDLSHVKMESTAVGKTTDNVNVMSTHASVEFGIKVETRSCDETPTSADVIPSRTAESEEKMELSADDQASAGFDETLLSDNEDILSIPEEDVIDCSTSDIDFNSDSPIQSDIEIDSYKKTIDDGSSLELREPILSKHDMTAEAKDAFRKSFNEKLNEFRIIGKKLCEDKKIPFPKGRVFNQMAFYLYKRHKLDVQNLELELTALPQFLAAKKADKDGKKSDTKHSELFKIDTLPTYPTLDLDFTTDSPIQGDAALTDSVGVQLTGTVDSFKNSTDGATGGKQDGAKGQSKIDDLKQSAKSIATGSVDRLNAKEYKIIGQQHCISKALTFPTNKRFVIILEELFEKGQLNEENLKVALEKDAQAAKRGEVPFVKLGQYCSSYITEQLEKFETIAKKVCEDEKIPIPSCADLRSILDDLFLNGKLEEKNLQLRLMQYALAKLTSAKKAEVAPKNMVPSPNVQKVVPPPCVPPSVVKPLQDITKEEKKEYKAVVESTYPLKKYKRIGQEHCISKALTFPTHKRFVTIVEALNDKKQLNEETLKVALEKEAQAAKRGEVPFVKLGEYCASYKSYKAEQLKKFETIANKYCEDEKIPIPNHADLKFIMDDLFSNGKLEEKTLQLRLMQNALAKLTDVHRFSALKNKFKPIVIKHCHKIKAPFPSRDYDNMCRDLLTAGMLDEENIKIAVEMNFEDQCNNGPSLTTEQVDMIIKHYRADHQINKGVMRAEVLKRIPAELLTLKHYWNLMYREKRTNLFWKLELNPDAAKYYHLNPKAFSSATTPGAANTKANQSKFGGPPKRQRPRFRGGYVSDRLTEQLNTMGLPWSKAELEARSQSVPKHHSGVGKRRLDEDPEFQQLLTQLAEKSKLLEELDRQNRNFTESGVTRETICTELRHTKFNMSRYKQGQPPLPQFTPERPSGSGVSSFGARDAMTIKQHSQSSSSGEHSRNQEGGHFESSRRFGPSGSGASSFGAQNAMTMKQHSQSSSFSERSRNQEYGNFEPSRPFGPSGSGASTVGSRDAIAIEEHYQSSSFGEHSRNPKDVNFEPSRQFRPSRSEMSSFGARDTRSIKQHSQSSSFGEHSREPEDGLSHRSQYSRSSDPLEGTSNQRESDRFNPPRRNENDGFILSRGNKDHSGDLRHKVNELKRIGGRMESSIPPPSIIPTRFDEISRNRHDMPQQSRNDSDKRYTVSDRLPSLVLPPPPPIIATQPAKSKILQQNTDATDWRYFKREPPRKKSRYDVDKQAKSGQSESQPRVIDDFDSWMTCKAGPSQHQPPPPPRFDESSSRNYNKPPPPKEVEEWRYTREQTPPKKKARFDEDRHPQTRQPKDLHHEMDEFDDWMNKNTRSSEDSSRTGRVPSFRPRASGTSAVKTNPPLIELGKICKVAIAHETYPEDRITTEEAVSIRNALLDRIGVQSGVAPRFSDTYEEGGAVVFECEDQLTVTWLWVNASTISPWRGAKLKPISWEKPLIEITLEVPKMMERQSPETICERLMSQNPGLSTKLWKFKHSELSSRGLNLIFQIDDKSKKSLESLGFKAYLGFSRVNVYIDEE